MNLYLFQDRVTVARIWKQPSLGSPIAVYIYTLKNLFGMPQDGLSAYRNDNSGPYAKPYPGSDVVPEKRIDHITHKGFMRALSGQDLPPTTQRFMRALEGRLETLPLSQEWVRFPDLVKFFQGVVGSSLVQAVFGPTLLALNPTFIEDLFQFDSDVPWLARAVPSFLLPGPYRVRRRLRCQIKQWYAYAREHFDYSLINGDGDADPIWGSELIRYQKEKVLPVLDQDDESLASADLALAWG